jgi:hypothetical protein
MSSKKKPQQTLADYVTIALSPVLIMALVGSLIFFLLEVLYVGQYLGRMQWILFFFVFGIVLIARISIELSGGRAMIYGIVMAFVGWVALQWYVEYGSDSMRAFSWAINFGLIALAWWCAHRLTWDCTYIDDRVDAAGKGVLEAAGLDDQREDEDGASRIEDRETVDEGHAPASVGLLAWWDRYCRYREEQLRKPHTPGVWVVYFSLAALPLFGLGQALIPPGEVDRRRYAFWLMVCYVGSGLALLVTTSFLGLRRYLRQRRLKMPAAMTIIWMALGGSLIVVMMVVGALLPRPYGEYRIIDSKLFGHNERNASRYAVLRDGAAKGEGQPSSDKASQKDGQRGSAKESDGRKGGSSNGKSAGKGSGQGEQGSAPEGQRAGGEMGKSGRQDRPQGSALPEHKPGEPSGSQNRSRQSDQQNADSRDSRDDQRHRQTGGPKLNQDEKGQESKTGQSNGETTSRPHNPVFEISQTLGWLGTVLKWVVFAALALVVLFFVLRSGLNFLANFTNWARQLLDALQAWWEGLFGRRESDLEGELEDVQHMPPPQPFASYANPFLDGRAETVSPDALARYSFEALEAWAWEHNLGRQLGETPLEFAERLGTLVPEWDTEVRTLAGLYVRLAYGRRSLTAECLGPLKRFWERLATAEEKALST